MTGGATLRVARMGRSPVEECGAAATSKPWGMRRVETQMAAPRHLPKQPPGASPPAAPPVWTRPGSSKYREDQMGAKKLMLGPCRWCLKNEFQWE